MKTPEIFYAEISNNLFEHNCPYCGSFKVRLYLRNKKAECQSCLKYFHYRETIVCHFAKDCELNGEEHAFRPELIEHEFRQPGWPIHRQINAREICTKCEAKRCK